MYVVPSPFCCAVIDLGNFGVTWDDQSFKQSMQNVRDGKFTLITASLNNNQIPSIEKHLLAAGFEQIKEIRNPKGGNIVRFYIKDLST